MGLKITLRVLIIFVMLIGPLNILFLDVITAIKMTMLLYYVLL